MYVTLCACLQAGRSRLLWRGPTWPILTWFVMEGLHQHSYDVVANELLERWLRLYRQSGIWEQYNPDTGEGLGTEGLGMSTLIVDWLLRKKFCNAERSSV